MRTMVPWMVEVMGVDRGGYVFATGAGRYQQTNVSRICRTCRDAITKLQEQQKRATAESKGTAPGLARGNPQMLPNPK